MLSNSSVVIGTNLAEICVDRNLRLVPKQLTLLNELNAAINNNLFTTVNSRDFIEPAIVMASSGVENEQRGIKSYIQSTHDTIMDGYIDDLSKLVTNYISFARNVVNKEVNTVKESLEAALANYKYKEPEDFFNVTYFKLHDVYNSYIVQNEIGGYKDSSGKFVFESMGLNKITEESFDLAKYILTGDEEQDALIQGWFSNLGKEKATGFITENIPEYSLSTDALLDYSMINYLFYRNLVEKNDLDLGLTAIQLRTKATSNRDYFGNKLGVALELYRKDIRIGKMLSSSSDTSFSYFNANPLNITVYEENFAKLAEGGANIEVLFGFIATSNTNDVTVDELLAAKENYAQKWANTRSLYMISLNNNRLNIFKQILREVFDANINKTELTEEEQGFLNEHPKFMDESKELGYAYIDQLHVSDIDDLDTIALELIGRIRYRFTNAYFILREMKENLAMSENMEPLEAALYATVKYITDYLVDQTDIVKF